MLRICLILAILLGGSVGIRSIHLETRPVLYEEKVFTIEERISRVLQDSGYSINMQHIILAKADLESGTFKNELTKKHNNVFSMLHSKRDPYSICGCGFAEGRSGYASYPSIEDQVYAYIWYTKRRQYPIEATPAQYVRYMKSKGYFEAEEKLYLKGLISRLNKYR